MNLITIILLGICWGLFGLRLAYAIWHRRLGAVFSRRIWIQVFLCLVAFTLFGEQAEQAIDRLFLGKPITLYVKSVALLGMIQLYEQTLQSINQAVEHYALLRWLGSGAILFLTAVFGLYFISPWMPLSDFRLEMIALRDAVMCIYNIFSFLPNGWSFWKREQVQSMKLKHAASMVCCTSYLVVSVGSIGAALLVLAHRPNHVDVLIQTFLPAIYLVAASFLLMLLPQRRPRIFSYPARLLIYWRLRQIENRVRHFGAIRNPNLQTRWVILDPEQLELAIYRSLIFVLDYHPFIRVSEEGEALYSAIHQIVRSPNSYPDLVNEIIKLK